MPIHIYVAVILVAAFLLFSGSAFPQGHHPKGFDPYAGATSQSGVNCCNGRDCARWEGAEPKRVKAEGTIGYMFGQWFVPDDRIMKPETLHVSERSFHHLCLVHNFTRCGYVAAGF